MALYDMAWHGMALLGMALRTIGHGENVAVVQFIKGGWEPGEVTALKAFGDAVKFHAIGGGFTWETQNRDEDRRLFEKALSQALIYLKEEKYKLVILDEINIAIKLGYIPIEKVLSGIYKRPNLTHVVLTGRDAHPDLINKADLVTEMSLVKHPFKDLGIKAQEGVLKEAKIEQVKPEEPEIDKTVPTYLEKNCSKSIGEV